jgi:D-alanine-D-alanine ligase
VEERWGAVERDWFERYAYPLTDEVWVVWSPDPEDWKPINHSCDPTAWLSGLDLVARRTLTPGDEITLDYATFCAPPMRDFECACGAGECRGTVRGCDHLEPCVERYGPHVSEYVRRAREAGADAARTPARGEAKSTRRRPRGV